MLVTDDELTIQGSREIIELGQAESRGDAGRPPRRPVRELAVAAKVTIEDLERWTEHGAIWRAWEVTDEHAVVELCSCTGEPMDGCRATRPS